MEIMSNESCFRCYTNTMNESSVPEEEEMESPTAETSQARPRISAYSCCKWIAFDDASTRCPSPAKTRSVSSLQQLPAQGAPPPVDVHVLPRPSPPPFLFLKFTVGMISMKTTNLMISRIGLHQNKSAQYSKNKHSAVRYCSSVASTSRCLTC